MTAARVVVLLLAAAAAALYLGPYRDGKRDEAQLAKVATVIAGRPVEIDCPGTFAKLTDVSSNDGSVLFSRDGVPADEARLSSGTCDRLTSLLHGRVSGLGCLAPGGECPPEVEDVAVAVNVLSHEAWHLAGVREEAVAQCYALQTNAETAIRLGASPEDAAAVAEFVFREVQPALPAAYRTSECHDGGPLDLHPESTSWPSAPLAP